MMRSIRCLLGNADGAVAPIVALSLVGLVAAGGIAFDYARLASMDTELQDAADQAALAAASQLDGQTGACERAASAASSLLTNQTRFADDNGGMAVVIPTTTVTDCSGNTSIQFYKSWNQATDTPGDPADADSNAKVVVVSVTPRHAVYTLTPIVAALRSQQMHAQAVASLSSAICKVPPVMMCNPTETAGNTSFNPSAYVGDGLRLTAVGNGSGTWAPGNFGFLDTHDGSSGAPGLRKGLGWTAPPGDCDPTSGVDTKPGATVTVMDAVNTRFDIYDGNANTVCPTGGSCPASINSVKDVRRPANASGNNSCKLQNAGWQLDTTGGTPAGTGYYGMSKPTTVADLPVTTTPSAMGHPRDECHAISNNGSCANGRIGDGTWDRDAYFRTNYVRTSIGSSGEAIGTSWTSAKWKANTGLSTTVSKTLATGLANPAYASRYNVYNWEIQHRDQTIDGVVILGPRNAAATGNALKSYGKPVCSPTQGYGNGLVPGSTTPDRRRVSVAVVNCIANGVKGNSTSVPVEKWIEVFLVEPSVNRNRTNNGDIYVEVIGETTSGGSGSTAGQVIRHDVPYLIK